MLQSLRGQLWKGFLNIEKKRTPGVYDKLVSKALGKRFSGKVRFHACKRGMICQGHLAWTYTCCEYQCA